MTHKNVPMFGTFDCLANNPNLHWRMPLTYQQLPKLLPWFSEFPLDTLLQQCHSSAYHCGPSRESHANLDWRALSSPASKSSTARQVGCTTMSKGMPVSSCHHLAWQAVQSLEGHNVQSAHWFCFVQQGIWATYQLPRGHQPTLAWQEGYKNYLDHKIYHNLLKLPGVLLAVNMALTLLNWVSVWKEWKNCRFTGSLGLWARWSLWNWRLQWWSSGEGLRQWGSDRRPWSRNSDMGIIVEAPYMSGLSVTWQFKVFSLLPKGLL